MFTLQPPRHIPTLPNAPVELSWHVGFTPDFGRMVATQELTHRAKSTKSLRDSQLRRTARL